MLVADQLVGVAVVPLKVTVLAPCVAPKLVPVMVTDALAAPLVGERLVTVAVGTTVKLTPLLATPPTVTVTLPVVAPAGTGATMLVADQLVGVDVVPLNRTVLAPCVAPKLMPVMVTDAVTAPLVGERLVTVAVGTTVKLTPLLATPPTVTVTLPVVAPAGTGATMLVADQLVGVAVVPLKRTVLVPCVAPKFVPVMVTDAATAPLVGERLVTVAVGTTVKLTPLLATPPTVTTTLPVVAPAGTGATMLVADQLVGVAAVPLKVTVLVPCVAPKFAPAIVMAVPTAPLVGDRLVTLGGTATVKVTPLLATPPTVTVTLPVVAPAGTGATMLVADQLVGVAAVPLKRTVLAPCVAPKFVPVIVTEVPTGPLVGDRLVTLGTVTVKLSPLLANPPTVTTMLPVVAPEGTGTTMLVADQLVGVAAVPLKVTVLVLCVAPKFVPVSVTDVPTGPLVGALLVKVGGTLTVNASPLLTPPSTVTTTLPLVAPVGTRTTMLVADQLVGVAVVPLNLTVLAPCVAPKPVPVIVTGVLTGPIVGPRLVRTGAGPAGTAIETSAEFGLVNPLVPYAWTTKKYV
jgi:hypothetical protein